MAGPMLPGRKAASLAVATREWVRIDGTGLVPKPEVRLTGDAPDRSGRTGTAMWSAGSAFSLVIGESRQSGRSDQTPQVVTLAGHRQHEAKRALRG